MKVGDIKNKLGIQGTVSGIVGAPNFQCSDLVGFGDDFFDGYWAYVLRDAGGAGAAPQGESLECTSYTSATGDFTVAAFTAAIAVGDLVLMIHPAVANMMGLTAARAAQLDATAAAKPQIKATTIDLNQAAATYDLFTGTTQDVWVDALAIRMSGGAIGGAVTSISIQTDDTTPQYFITAVEGAVANLTDQNQLSWAPAGGKILLKAGKKIQLTIAGGASGVARVCDVVCGYQAVVAGGYLA